MIALAHSILVWFSDILTLYALLDLATSLFVVQVPLSALWLRRYAYGPMEWLWQQFTYGRRTPLARAVSGERALPATKS